MPSLKIPSETHDDDLDGVGNNTDAFPQDENETHDDDGDGVGNNSDAFPQDANETMDSDGDGVGDNTDPEPDNPDVRTPQDISVEISDTSSYILAGAIVFLALVILFVRRKHLHKLLTHQLMSPRIPCGMMRIEVVYSIIWVVHKGFSITQM